MGPAILISRVSHSALSLSYRMRYFPAMTTWNWPLQSVVLIRFAGVNVPSHSTQTMWHWDGGLGQLLSMLGATVGERWKAGGRSGLA